MSRWSYRITKRPARASPAQSSAGHHSIEAIAPMIISTAGWFGSPNASVQSSASPKTTIFSVIRTIVPPSSRLLVGHGS